MKKLNGILGKSGQWFAGVVVLMGLIVELIMRSHIGYILITSGAFAFAIFTKLRYHRSRIKF